MLVAVSLIRNDRNGKHTSIPVSPIIIKHDQILIPSHAASPTDTTVLIYWREHEDTYNMENKILYHSV